MTFLHTIGEAVRNILGSIPLFLVRWLFIAVPLIVLLWVLSLPREATTSPEGKGRWDANLKVWAALALLAQIVIYCLL